MQEQFIDEAVELAASILKVVEGFKPTTYLCTAGKLTIGYGRTLGVKQGDTSTPADEEAWMRKKIDNILYLLLSLHKDVPLAPHHLASLISFIYNVGESAYKDSTLRKLVQKQEWKAASNEFGKWIYVTNGKRKVVDQGLKGRRRPKERAMFLGDKETSLTP
jgi:lysozyme